MIPGHECSAWCAGDAHCELAYASFDHHPARAAQDPPWRTVRGWFDDAYRRAYGARVLRVEPAREARPVAQVPAEELTPLVGPGLGTWPWLVWFVPAGPAADAVAAAEEAAFAARLGEIR